MKVQTVMGDITKIDVDAIATLINPEGMWYGGVDGAIQRVAGGGYHQQAGDILDTYGLEDGQVVVARGDKNRHRGNFNDVIFVVDALQRSVGELVAITLEVAKKEQYQAVALPAMRTGVMLGAYSGETNAFTTIAAIAAAVENFYRENPKLDLTVYFVIYNDSVVEHMLSNAVKHLPAGE